MQKQISMGDILAEYGEPYISNNNIKGQHKGLIRLLASCRTIGLGSHFENCTHCDYMGKSYNSCRNRHCPLCQQKDKEQWMEKRMKELLPVGYYHLVFTIPHQLNSLCLQNKKVMYDILFKAASQTILELAKDTKHLGADTGLITVLHTWGQNMKEHPHLHCIMPAGGLAFDKSHWVHTDKKNDFFVYYKVISRKFQGKFLDLLIQAFDKGLLEFKGDNVQLSSKKRFNMFKDKLYKINWVVNIQKPFDKPEKVLEYLARYVFRIAITNRRILEVKNGKVLFAWKDYRTNLYRKMWLDIDEFIRRFLLHTLPEGFFKIRYYGIFASTCRKKNIETAKQLLAEEQNLKVEQDMEDHQPVWKKKDPIWNELLEMIQKHKNPNCPKCKKGYLKFAGIVPENHLLTG